MVGLRSPLVVHPLQAFVTEPFKPWLDAIVVSASLHTYVSQSSRGELVAGASLDPYELTSMRSTLDFAEGLAGHMLDLFPCLSDVKVLRQWAWVVRHDSGLFADHGHDADCGLLHRRGLGHLGL